MASSQNTTGHSRLHFYSDENLRRKEKRSRSACFQCFDDCILRSKLTETFVLRRHSYKRRPLCSLECVRTRLFVESRMKAFCKETATISCTTQALLCYLARELAANFHYRLTLYLRSCFHYSSQQCSRFG